LYQRTWPSLVPLTFESDVVHHTSPSAAVSVGVSDIDTAAVDSLRALDPDRPIREADID